jgi:tetratricopeptide (TPR) repeat protein
VAPELPEGSPPPSRWVFPALAALAVIATFSSALSGSFQQWDDVVLLVDNPAYRGLGWANLKWMFTTNLMGHYMPLTWITYGLDYLVWGLDPYGYHLTNIVVHAANTVLVYLVAQRLFRIVWPGTSAGGGDALRIAAALAALVFGVHPLRVESVAWITERRDVLSGFFFLLAVLMYLRACEVESRDGRRWSTFYWAAVGTFVLALLSKSMAVTLPVVLLVLDVYPLRRLRPGARGWLTPGPWRIWQEKLPFLFVGAVVSAVAFRALLGGANATSWERLGLLERVAVSAYSVAFYLRKTLVPLELSPLYELSLPVHMFDRRFLVSGVVVLFITLAALASIRRWPGVLAVWTCYVVMLLPVAGIFHNGYQMAADRYSYLPGVGWALLAGGAGAVASRGLRRARSGRRALVALAGVLVVAATAALALTAWRQAKIWQDDETLWRHAARLDPASSVAASNLGSGLRLRGKLAEAVEQSERALLLRPAYVEAHLNLGLAKAALGRAGEAERHFRQVLEIRPRSAPAHVGLGALLETQGRLDEALEHFRQALQITPRSASIHNDLGVALARSGRISEALPEFLEAVRIDPGLAAAQNNLGRALAQTGRLTEAADHFRAAIHARPDFQEAQQNLEYTLRLLGR